METGFLHNVSTLFCEISQLVCQQALVWAFFVEGVLSYSYIIFHSIIDSIVYL